MFSNSNDFSFKLMYIIYMKKKPLIETNPYLQDPEKREAAIIISVATSSAIEGVYCKGIEGPQKSGGEFAVKKPSATQVSSKSKRSNP